MCLSIEWKLYTCRNYKRETVEKNSSTIGPSAGIEPTPVGCRCTALTTGYLAYLISRLTGPQPSVPKKYSSLILNNLKNKY